MTRKRTNDYWQAPSGDGPHAATWKDKPHRLVYDLTRIVETLADSLVDVIDGNDEHDIRANTELPENRCKEIYDLYRQLLDNQLPAPGVEIRNPPNY